MDEWTSGEPAPGDTLAATAEPVAMPRRIFQTWKSKTEFPPLFSYWSETLRSINPEWEHVLWDDDDNLQFIRENYPWFLPTYTAFRAEIYRADAIRYFFLYQFGGFYADMDVQCLQPLDILRGLAGVVLGRMGTDIEYQHSIPNAIMASTPREEFWLLVISLMVTADKNADPEYVTGPVILRRAVDLYVRDYGGQEVQQRLRTMRELMPDSRRSTVNVLPAHFLYPLNHHDAIHDMFRRAVNSYEIRLTREQAQGLFAQALTVTYWSHTWSV